MLFFETVRITPDGIEFDYTNFMEQKSVTVFAVDDFVDEGDSQTDSVVFVVDSLDDVEGREECEDADIDRICGQAVSYDGYEIDALDIIVLDDDVAGLIVSNRELVATYSNFGEPLLLAAYNITLTSRPLSEVHVSISTSTEFSSTFPDFSRAFVNFDPEVWDVPVTVFIAASAPTTDRPACSEGTRYCDLLGTSDSDLGDSTREEIITHSVSSSDSFYANLLPSSIPTIMVSVSLVRDSVDPPTIDSAKFEDLLNEITIYFDKDTNRGGQSGRFRCGLLLDLSSEEEVALFGKDSVCTFPEASMLRITFGEEASVVPYSASARIFELIEGKVQADAEYVSLFSTSQSFLIDQPDRPTRPEANLAASTLSVGVCDGVTLDGSASSGSGGRAMVYKFSTSWINGPTSASSLKNMTRLLDDANNHSSGNGLYRVRLPSDVMPRGSTFDVTLMAKNFLGFSHTSTVSISKLDVPAPTIRITGMNPRTDATFSSSLKVQAVASLPTMTCVSSSLANAKMQFIWTEASGKFDDAEVETFISKNPLVLNIPPESLQPLESYEFKVLGRMSNNHNLNNSASIVVEVAQQPLIAVIAGGSSRQVGQDSTFVLDARESEDPDESSEEFTYSWDCKSLSSDSCDGLGWASSTPITSSVSVSASSLATGLYVFTLHVAKGSTRNATTTSNVEIVLGAPPVIVISGINSGTKFNTEEGQVQLSATVTSSLAYTTQWLVSKSDVPSIFISRGEIVATVSNELAAIISLAALTEGSAYTLQLKATDSEGVSAVSTVSLNINLSPSSGKIEVTPPTGFTLDTGFDFVAVNWVDEDLPLKYIFGTVPFNGDFLTLDTTASSQRPFGDMRADASLSGVTLRVGSNFTNFSIGVFTQVIDLYGAAGLAAGTVRVLPKVLTVRQLANISQVKATAAIESKDADAARQILAATTSSLISATSETDTSRRRHLLAKNNDVEDARQLRANLLSNLWETYDITAVTEADMASLLNNLEGIVDTPEEIYEATGSGSISFLRDVLQTSINAGIGISSSGSASVASALSSIFEVESMFNTSDLKSLEYAANVTEVLRLSSTLQLKGSLAGGSGVSLIGDLIDMYSYRSTVAAMSEPSVSLELEDSADMRTTVVNFYNISATSLSKTDEVIDIFLATLDENIFESTFKGTAGSASARDANGGVGSKTANLPMRLRSKPTIVEVSAQDSTVPLEIRNLPSSSRVVVTIPVLSSFAFNTTFNSYRRMLACNSNGQSVPLNCPLDPSTEHICDLPTYGNGDTYFFEYVCPMIVPTCLTWNADLQDFSSDTLCVVESGYTDSMVSCSCSSLSTPLALGSNTTAHQFTASYTTDPTLVPIPMPTAAPTHSSVLNPTPSPNSPVMQPSSSPSFYPTLQLLSANPTSRPSTEELTIVVDESNSKKSPNAASGAILIIVSSLLALVGMLIALLCYKKGYLQFGKPKDADDDVLPVHEQEMVMTQEMPSAGVMSAVDLMNDADLDVPEVENFNGSRSNREPSVDFIPTSTLPETNELGRRQITF